MRAKQLSKVKIRDSNTVAGFADQWLAEVVQRDRKDAHQIRRYVEKDIKPAFGSRRLSEVTASDVLSLTDRIKKHRGAEHSALLVRNILKRMYAYAIARQVAETNPAALIEAKYIATAKARDRALSTDEIATLLRRVYLSTMRESHKLGIHLLLLTMVRKTEMTRAMWSDIDFNTGEWQIPNTKAGKPHVVYLSRQAANLFHELKSLAGTTPYVFPSRSSLRKPISDSTLNTAIRALGVDMPDFVLHDFRRTASTHLHEAGYPADVVETALAHAIPGVRGVYNKAKYASQRREMLQHWADLIDSLITDNKVILGRFGKAT